MLSSGNDAANVIAQFVSGSIEQFMQDLNNFFKEKGIKETRFNNPHGLHHPEHYTTAFDMALITKEAMKKPLFREIVKTIHYTRPETNKQPATTLVQSNRLLRRGSFFYPKAVGVKTGYHSKAGYTLVGAAEQDGRLLIAVVLGCTEMNKRFKDVIALFEAAFAEKKVSRTLFSKQYDTFTIQVTGSKSPLIATLSEDLKMDYFPSEEPIFKAFLKWNQMSLPIKEGQVVGEIQLKTDQGTILKHSLFASSEVQMTAFFKIIRMYRKMSPIVFSPAIILCLMGIVSCWGAVYFYRKSKVNAQ